MKKIFKVEMNRAFKGGGMWLALAIGILIAIAHIIQYQIPASRHNSQMDFTSYQILYPLCVSDTWMAGNTFNLESFLYFLITPILATLPFGTTYFSDREGGFLKGIYTRISRKQYLLAKYVVTFLSGGTAVCIPLIVNLLGAFVLLPNLLPPTVMTQNGISAIHFLYQIYFTHPMVYLVFFLILDFLLGGIFACVALASSFISDYKVMVAICPFFLQFIIHVVCSILNKLNFSSVYFAQSGYGIQNTGVVLAYLIIGISATFIIFKKKGEKEDVF